MDPFDPATYLARSCRLGCRPLRTIDDAVAHLTQCQGPALEETMLIAASKRGSRRWLPRAS